MRLIFLLFNYVWWHYTTAIENLFANYLNLLAFLRNFFSIKHLIRNLFAPWRRMGEEYPSWLKFEAFFSVLIVNILMRLVGFIVRTLLIIAGVAILIVSVFLFILALFAWLSLPFVVIFLFIFGWQLILA